MKKTWTTLFGLTVALATGTALAQDIQGNAHVGQEVDVQGALRCGKSLRAGAGIQVRALLDVGHGIAAGDHIACGNHIQAGWGIKTLGDIRAACSIRAGCTCCPTATCWWPNPTSPSRPRTCPPR